MPNCVALGDEPTGSGASSPDQEEFLRSPAMHYITKKIPPSPSDVRSCDPGRGTRSCPRRPPGGEHRLDQRLAGIVDVTAIWPTRSHEPCNDPPPVTVASTLTPPVRGVRPELRAHARWPRPRSRVRHRLPPGAELARHTAADHRADDVLLPRTAPGSPYDCSLRSY
jgi:hypothetical protein